MTEGTCWSALDDVLTSGIALTSYANFALKAFIFHRLLVLAAIRTRPT